MKNLFPLLLSAQILLCNTTGINAQTPFSTYDSINVNNINARQLVHGDMWWDPSLDSSKCVYSTGYPHTLFFASGIWMSGYDTTNQMHISAQTYRQNGNDYWPGPLDGSGDLTYASSQDWARIWKVSASDISAFNAIMTHTVSNTSQAILEWPAKGNPYAKGNNNVSLSVNVEMAPFVDVNSDGVYNPLQGDYPAIKGDEALWWVFSDNGPTHTETNGTPLKVEVHTMAYAYKRGTLIDNVVYYEYSVYNRSISNYTNFRFGQYADVDIAFYAADYAGFDSSYRMAIGYCGKTVHGSGQMDTNAKYIPMAGITMIVLPGDNGNNYVPAGSFMYINNDNSALGNPQTPDQYNDYMRSIWLDSTHVVNNFHGYGIASSGHGTGPLANYIYTGDPGNHTEWSECSSNNAPGNRRIIIASNDFTLNAGSSQKVVMALVASNPTLGNGCPNTNFDSIKIVADTAWKNYFNPPPASVNNIISTASALLIYPNPAHDILFIETPVKNTANENIRIYNALGQIINIPIIKNAGKTEIGINCLPSGVYNILYSNNEIQKSASFIKY